MHKNKKKQWLTTAAASLMLLAMGLTGVTMAYLTDSETVTNKFTVGDVKIELLEPEWPGNDNDKEIDDLVPNEEVNKNPKVANTGVNDTVVFLTVDSPMEYITLVNDDGTPVKTYKKTVTESYTDEAGVTKERTVVENVPAGLVQEIVWFKDAADVASKHENNFDSNWQELTAKEMYIVVDRHGNETVVAMKEGDKDPDQNWDLDDVNENQPLVKNPLGVDATNKITARQKALQTVYQNLPSDSKLVKRYVFAYKTDIQGSTVNDDDAVRASAKLGDAASERETTTLFDKIQLKNFIENQIDKTGQDIEIRAYAIQDSQILENSIDLGVQPISEQSLNHIYDIFVHQNSQNYDGTGTKVINLRDADSVVNTSDGEIERTESGSFTDPSVSHVNRWNTTTDVSGDGANLKP